ncbi:MAG: hypothetical protein H6R16_1707 [Proteobacteria bacterium]|nr:hypothetical protein [Pseudomonadota bacterium]
MGRPHVDSASATMRAQIDELLTISTFIASCDLSVDCSLGVRLLDSVTCRWYPEAAKGRIRHSRERHVK